MTTMKAMVYYGANDIRFEDRPIPTILHPGDAIIKLEKVTICGTELGICKGKNPEIEQEATRKEGSFNGRILRSRRYWHCGRSRFRRSELQKGRQGHYFLCQPLRDL